MTQAPVGSITEVSGKATVTHPDGTIETAAIGMPVYQGDIVETDAAGALNIKFADESTFAVSQNAKLTIDEYVYDPGSDAGTQNFSLLRGVFVFTSGLIGRDDPDDVHIHTPIGSIGIRGTTIAGHINPDGQSRITVTEGAIVFSNDTGSVTLSEHNETIVMNGSGGDISNVGAVSQEDMHQNYNVLRSVAPAFFAGAGDTGGEGTTNSGNIPDAEQPAAPANDDDQTAPPPAPMNTAPASQPDSNVLPQNPAQDAAPEQGSVTPQEVPALDSGSSTSFDGSVPFDSSTAIFDAALPSPDYTISASTAGTITIIASPPPSPPPSSTTNIVPQSPPAQQNMPPPLLLNTLGGTEGAIVATGAPGLFLGSNVTALGDFNHDGLADFVYTDKIDPGSIYVNAVPFSGAFTGNSSQISVSGIGDFDGDGSYDFIIGAPFADDSIVINPGPGGTGNAMILSTTSALSVELDNLNSMAKAGARVDGIGDINGDGFSDVIVSADGAGAGAGAAYVLLGKAAPLAVLDVSSLGANGFALVGAGTDHLGNRVSGAGDFNRDGFNDFIVTSPGSGEIMIGFGKLNAGAGDYNPATGTGFLTVNLGVSPLNTMPVTTLGDFNGDGVSDITITDVLGNGGRGIVHMLYGNGSYGGGSSLDLTGGAVPTGSGFSLKLSTTSTGVLVGGGDPGDFNGDGLDDLALAVRTGDKADIYVLYGRPGLSGTIIMADPYLNNPANAFHMVYDLQAAGLANPATDPFKFSISGAGDTNGDGFDDLIIGTPDFGGGGGQVFLVNGRPGGANPINGTGTAVTNGDHLVGTASDDVFNDANFNGVRINGGAGNDIFNLQSPGLSAIDGGTGFDVLGLLGANKVLDFTNASPNMMLRGSESLSGIDMMQMMNNNQTIKIGIDDIFRLLQESEMGTLMFKEDNSGGAINTTLLVDDNGPASAGPLGTWLLGQGFSNGGTDTTSDPGTTFDVYNFGTGYHLLIDQNIDSKSVV